MDKDEESVFFVWINRKDCIVSFEEVAGYEKLAFSNHEEKLQYVVQKGSAGFRIQ